MMNKKNIRLLIICVAVISGLACICYYLAQGADDVVTFNNHNVAAAHTASFSPISSTNHVPSKTEDKDEHCGLADLNRQNLNADNSAKTGEQAISGFATLEKDAHDKLVHELAASANETELALAYSLIAYRSAADSPSQNAGYPSLQSIPAQAIAALDQLAQLATHGKDPLVYSLAYRACRSFPGASESCSQISAVRWQQLAPQDVNAILANLASPANAAGDTQTYETLYRASQVLRWQDWPSPILQVINTQAFQSLSLAVQDAILLELVGIAAADVSQVSPILRYCKKTGPETVNQMQLCSELVDRMSQPESSMLMHNVALAIAQHLQLPPQKIAALRDSIDASRAYGMAQFTDEIGLRCSGMRKKIQYFQSQIEYGEVGAALRGIQATHQTIQEYAAQYRIKRENGSKSSSTPAN
jgi:hypothetical protein